MRQVFAPVFLVCLMAVVIATTGCGKKDAPAQSETEPRTPSAQEFFQDLTDSTSEQPEEDSSEATGVLNQGFGDLARVAEIGKEISDRTAEAARDADLTTPDGRREFADELEVIAQDVQERIPELQAAAQERVRDMVEALERRAEDTRQEADRSS